MNDDYRYIYDSMAQHNLFYIHFRTECRLPDWASEKLMIPNANITLIVIFTLFK